jgi:hypothetical protein
MTAPVTGTPRPGLSAGPTSEFSLFFRVKQGAGESTPPRTTPRRRPKPSPRT